jgi:hypothetical protein
MSALTRATRLAIPRPRHRVSADALAETFRRRRPSIEPLVSDAFRAELRNRLIQDRGAA